MNIEKLALSAPITYPLDPVAAMLRQAGVSVVVAIDPSTERVISSHGSLIVLIFPEQAVVSLGEQTTLVRTRVGGDARLILCAPQPSPMDRRLLSGCGASYVISPRSWAPEHVAERILAEVILAGNVIPSACGSIIGGTAALQDLCRQIQILAPLDDPVLILGETGVGKDLVASELHRQSLRPGQYLPINCAAISRDLLQSELFGHERGAFTNAIQARKGLLVDAGRGTVFLDEIGELDLDAQAKLLRVVEERRVMPVGSNRWQQINARIVMATNREIEKDVAEGRFRRDLFMRLRGFTLSVPALREHRADLPLLAQHFVEEYNSKQSLNLKVPEGVLDSLFLYEWPGNVRELRSAVRKSAAFANRASGFISAAMLLEAVRTRNSASLTYSVPFDPAVDTWQDVIRRAQRAYFRAVMAVAGGSKEIAAKRAGISRTQLYEKLKTLDTDRN